ncbi:MAG: hypothetical protein ACXVXP_13435 [Mycobacteriaceae bacterium]
MGGDQGGIHIQNHHLTEVGVADLRRQQPVDLDPLQRTPRRDWRRAATNGLSCHNCGLLMPTHDEPGIGRRALVAAARTTDAVLAGFVAAGDGLARALAITPASSWFDVPSPPPSSSC